MGLILNTARRASKPDRCAECGSSFLVSSNDTGEIVCRGCGLVLSEHVMDHGPEWRAFTLQEKADRSRVGSPASILQADKGLLTVIDKVNKDAYGREVSLATRQQMWRLRKWQIRTRFHSSVDRNLLQALAELDRMVDKVHVSEDTHEDAADIYRKALDRGLVRGRSISAIVAASLYAACRKSTRPRSLKEIASVSLIKKKDIARCYRLLLREMSFKMPIADPKTYITKIASKVNITDKRQNLAIQLLKDAEKNKMISGKDPMGLAAAALYISCVLGGDRKTQKEIAEAAGVTEVTVRNRYKGLKDSLNINA
ncbi:MAG: transcription initiation factor IIB family protein [Candidatus Bathyarchaeia archaeon]